MESIGDSGKHIGDGISSGVGQGMDALDRMGGAASAAEASASALGNTGMAAGRKIKTAFDNAASASDGLGTSFAKNFTRAGESGKRFGDSIKTGVVGAVDTAVKKVSGFTSDIIGSAKKIGNAFLHPVDTIKNTFSGAMAKAGALGLWATRRMTPKKTCRTWAIPAPARVKS